MSENNNLFENEENVKKKLEYDQQMRKIREEVEKKFSEYKKIMEFMAGDAPLSILCLSQITEKALLRHGCLRIYDLFNCNFAEVEGLSPRHITELTTRLDQFFSMF